MFENYCNIFAFYLYIINIINKFVELGNPDKNYYTCFKKPKVNI